MKGIGNPDGQSLGKVEGLAFWNGRGNTRREDETHSPVGGDITNILLLELL